MITKEQVKNEIDKLPEDLVEEIHRFIDAMLKKEIKKKPISIHSFKLNGVYDNLNIRAEAYD